MLTSSVGIAAECNLRFAVNTKELSRSAYVSVRPHRIRARDRTGHAAIRWKDSFFARAECSKAILAALGVAAQVLEMLALGNLIAPSILITKAYTHDERRQTNVKGIMISTPLKLVAKQR